MQISVNGNSDAGTFRLDISWFEYQKPQPLNSTSEVIQPF